MEDEGLFKWGKEVEKPPITKEANERELEESFLIHKMINGRMYSLRNKQPVCDGCFKPIDPHNHKTSGVINLCDECFNNPYGDSKKEKMENKESI